MILITVADFVTVVAALDADKVIIARENYLESDFKSNIAVVDDLIATPIGRSDNFNGTAEAVTYTTKYKGTFTIDFYGPGGQVNANKFIGRLNSQQAYEFKRDNDIEVFHNTTLTNVKKLQGKTLYDRYQIEIMVKYSTQFTDDVLRIDTLQYQVYTNN